MSAATPWWMAYHEMTMGQICQDFNQRKVTKSDTTQRNVLRKYFLLSVQKVFALECCLKITQTALCTILHYFASRGQSMGGTYAFSRYQPLFWCKAPPANVGALTIHALTNHYFNSMTTILDTTAPLQLKRLSTKDSKPWCDGRLNEDRRALRLVEWWWRSSPSSDHLKLLRVTRNSY